MKCSFCGGRVEWQGPLTNLTHTKCLSCGRTNCQEIEQDPYQDEEYQKFVSSMVPHCHCGERNRPCDGVLAGGVCEGIKDERDDERDYDDRND